MVSGQQPAEASWDRAQAEIYLRLVDEALSAPGRKASFTVKLATGRQLSFQMGEAHPDDFYFVFRPRKILSIQANSNFILLHQGYFKGLLSEIRNDKRKHPAIVYMLADVARLAGQVNLADRQRVVYDLSEGDTVNGELQGNDVSNIGEKIGEFYKRYEGLVHLCTLVVGVIASTLIISGKISSVETRIGGLETAIYGDQKSDHKDGLDQRTHRADEALFGKDGDYKDGMKFRIDTIYEILKEQQSKPATTSTDNR